METLGFPALVLSSLPGFIRGFHFLQLYPIIDLDYWRFPVPSCFWVFLYGIGASSLICYVKCEQWDVKKKREDQAVLILFRSKTIGKL